MTDTVRDRILAAIEERATLLADEFEMEPSGDPSRFPSLAAFDGGHMVIDRDGMITRRVMTLTIEGYVQGADGWQPTRERNALHAALVAALVGEQGDHNPSTLGGIVEMIEDTDLRMATAVMASQRRLMFAQDFEITFVTNRIDPARAG